MSSNLKINFRKISINNNCLQPPEFTGEGFITTRELKRAHTRYQDCNFLVKIRTHTIFNKFRPRNFSGPQVFSLQGNQSLELGPLPVNGCACVIEGIEGMREGCE